jgi:hypothetical protein
LEQFSAHPQLSYLSSFLINLISLSAVVDDIDFRVMLDRKMCLI